MNEQKTFRVPYFKNEKLKKLGTKNKYQSMKTYSQGAF